MKIAMKSTARQPVFASITEEERAIRQDLAACYRLVALFGWDDLLATHISARVATPDDDAFLINPIGFMFEEITASSLVKVNLDGEILQETPYAINRAGFVIHSAVHGVRRDAGCVIHLHTKDGVAVSALSDGLLPLNQTAMLVAPHIAFHEYEGIATNEAERARLVADLGEKPLMLLRNHGTLSVGESIAEAFMQMYFLEWACTVQVRTLGTGRNIHRADENVVKATGAAMNAKADSGQFARELMWPALLRKIDRSNPGYRD